MPPAIPLSAMFLAAATGCGLLTATWVGYARARQHIHDQPGQRRLHATPTPRGGGIAIALVMLLALVLLAAGSGSAKSAALLTLAAGTTAFAACGLLDDLVPLPSLVKFLLQLVCAALLVIGLSSGWTAGWLASAGLIVLCAYTVNIWNFMDGSNGMISLQALVIALALALWPGQPDYLRFAAIALAGACAGFLPFNLPRARVFLGDVGSHALGSAIFGLLLMAWLEGVINLPQTLLLSGTVLLDSGYTLLRRAGSGKPVWRAHREHLYQYAVRTGHSHARVGIAYAAWTAVAVGLAWMGGQLRSSLVMWALFMFYWALGTVVYFGFRRRWLGARTRRGVTGD